jgi:hypothetical protein
MWTDFLLSCGLSNDTVSNSDYIAWRKEADVAYLGALFRHSYKTTKGNHEKRQDSNRAPPLYRLSRLSSATCGLEVLNMKVNLQNVETWERQWRRLHLWNSGPYRMKHSHRVVFLTTVISTRLQWQPYHMQHYHQNNDRGKSTRK